VPGGTETVCRARVVGDKVEFELSSGRQVTGVVCFTVFDADGKRLWALDNGQSRLAKITYGEVPAGGDHTWTQEYPKGGEAPVDIRGKRIKVQICSTYNNAFGAGGQGFETEINVPRK
jgi:hypothetical protein